MTARGFVGALDLRTRALSWPDPGEPIRSELFSVERLEQHAESLAAAQPVSDKARGYPIKPRLDDNGRILLDTYRAIAQAIREEREITPAAEWLVDNFHIVEEQLREIRDHLPTAFYRELPKLSDGFLQGYPRVVGIAWAYVAHSDSRFDPETLRRFVRAYQRVQPLRIGELWAVAITLRIVLVENLRRLAERIVSSRTARVEADALADTFLGVGGRTGETTIPPRLQKGPLETALVVQLIQRLREHDPATIPALRWLHERLAADGTNIEEIVRAEHQRQAAMTVTIRNVITSMRLISGLDWKEFFESVSLVDEVLRNGSVFAEMDFPTRDRYRHAIEDLARGATRSEIDVAQLAVARAAADPDPDDSRRRDPGFYLISHGRPDFERELGFRPSLRHRLIRAYTAASAPAYFATIAVLSLCIVALPLVRSALAGLDALPALLLGLLALIPATDLAVALANRGVSESVGPKPLAKLELAHGIPPELRTLLVVPVLLTSDAEVSAEVDRLEVHYLANPDAELRLALLSDWTDADQETTPADARLLATAAAGIAQLNARHGPTPDGEPRFLLLHRRRVWNESQQRWLGWERKRGKLHELNRLILGATDTTFIPVDGHPPAVPAAIRYVITLDADTRAQAGTARALVGTLAHPLNRARFDATERRVVEGYGVLQPRIAPTLPDDDQGSLFQRIFSGPAGVDPYAAAISDVYQDLFGEGSYTGKGIYDVAAFEASLEGRVSENTLLSHDLFEGTYARTGLVTDVAFFEEFPTSYAVASARQHRWARGDWQLLPWIAGRLRHSVPGVGRWKMADNLRRTLSAPAAFLTLVLSWSLPPPIPGIWVRFIVAMVALPAIVSVLAELIPRRRGISKRSHAVAVLGDVVTAAAQTLLVLTLLADQARLMADAVIRTLARLYITGRRRLEWVTAAQAKSVSSPSLASFYRRMGIAVGMALGALALVATRPEETWLAAGPLVALWLAAPAVAWLISLPPRAPAVMALSHDDARLLRLAARETWRFFDTFVCAADRELPPDNFQEDPKPVVAHRTSPTNLGLSLLATVTAHDFGWIGTVEAAERLDATLASMEALERFHGHFFNWYDTRDGRPLEPRYLSSVDSGNLAGHLLTLKQACHGMIDGPAVATRVTSGIGDALTLLRRAARAITDEWQTPGVGRQHLDEAIEALEARLRAALATPGEWPAQLAALGDAADVVVDIANTLSAGRTASGDGALSAWAEAVRATIRSHARDATAFLAEATDAIPTVADAADAGRDGAGAVVRRLSGIAQRAVDLFDPMDFGLFLDRTRNLLSIGYRVADGAIDPSFYDLLASEARLASFVAVAKGDAPPSHWFRLGRAMTPVDRGSALVSWSGSMFEYLMPYLVMRSPAGSLLQQTYELVVRRQIQYGSERGVPWGVSESAYSARDLDLTYQYSNFGVPGLGLERGLGEEVVVAPYATALAAMVDPKAAARNFRRLTAIGARGAYGFYEALDFTPERLPEGADHVIVRAHMAHHQGMSVIAIGNVLHDGVMRTRFHAEPLVQAVDLLLQERPPRDVPVARPRADEVSAAAHVRADVPPAERRFDTPHDPVPRTHLLSNGRYAVMLTSAGSGYSRWKDLAVTRWREDVTRDPWGQYVFLRDTQSGRVWSAAHQPSGVEADTYEAIFAEDHAEIHRRDGALASTLELVVSPEDDAEMRRLSITNHGMRTREIELTSYAEIALAPPAADAAHPAFSNLFVQTEWVPELSALLATRRQRGPEDPQVWAAHVMTVQGESTAGVQYETDRARFLGRGRGLRTAVSVQDGRPLSNTAGAVLDPIFSLRHRVRLPGGANARITLATLIAPTREAALDLVDKYRDPATFEREMTLAWTQAQVQLHHLIITPDDAHLFQRLANRILYSDASLRPPPDLLARWLGPQSGLWPHRISGDLPILLVRIDEAEDENIVRQALQAHEYFRLKNLAVDLVIVNEKPSSYVQDLQAALETLVRTNEARLHSAALSTPGSVVVLRGDLVSAEDRELLKAAARVVLLSRQGTLSEQVMRMERSQVVSPLRRPPPPPRAVTERPPPRPELEFFNGLGGFADDGREYVTILGEGQWTPAPWINVIANPGFGCQVSECGAGYAWAANSRENQLTAWTNDPVSDPPGDTIFVRDEESGEVWSPTPLPIRENAPYVVRHGQGYSRFEHASHGIGLELLHLVPLEDPVRLSRLTIENRSGRPRRLSVTAYVEWVLGASRSAAAPYLVTEVCPETGALLARNPWCIEFGGRVAFLDVGARPRAWTGDRTEFLGRNGTLDHPAALEAGQPLSGRVGAGLDPCGALQTTFTIAPGMRTSLVVLLGQGKDAEETRALIARYRTVDVDGILAAVTTYWDDTLGTLQVKTPDRSMDLLVNRWLLYQTLVCRVWARAAFYQASGAYGFRDQLQDVSALVVARRDIARAHLLRAAARQFVEGDVQHWWHPPSGRGIRTHVADDVLWLPYATAAYLDVTGDAAVLDESVPFLEGPPIPPDKSDAYFEPTVSGQSATLFEHCARAIDRSLAVGSHQLPLMWTGDWNDGMNRVGPAGKGESVWLGWFLHIVLSRFAPIAQQRSEQARAGAWSQHRDAVARALDEQAWDGDWYRRAYFDDGTPLGSASSGECRIDSIAQSWSVISGAGDPARATRAMAAVEEFLVRRGDGLVVLFTPPFDRTPHDPGYIKGYPPGIRENGGQYTHAALWSVIAYAALGDGDKAGELFAILNPINHTSTRAGVHRYRVEPYVVAGDVYAEPPHVGRGGWTWYTGSAGWMHRAALEWILGFRLRGTALHLDPCIPRAWRRFDITFRYHSARYAIMVENPHGVTRGVSTVEVDGVRSNDGTRIALADDGATHQVHVVLGPSAPR